VGPPTCVFFFFFNKGVWFGTVWGGLGDCGGGGG